MGAVKRVKNVEWEKNRRERLNSTFFELSRLLPDHDPTLTLTKLEILNKSIMYIKDLREKNDNLLGTNQSEVLEAEMTSLREQVAELQRRNQQLAELLQAAKISLPPRPLPHSKLLTCPRKWAGKLSLESVTGIKNTSEEKKGETKENPLPRTKLPIHKKHFKLKKNLKTKVIKHSKTQTSKSETSVLNSSINPLRELNNTKSVQSVTPKSETMAGNSASVPLRELNSSLSVHSVSQTKIKRTVIPHPAMKGVVCTNGESRSIPVAGVPVGNASVQSTLVLSRTVTLPCTTISLVLSNSKTSIVTVAKSNVLPAPIMATGIQPVLQCNPSLSSLGPGTLIMPGGRIVPVPPPSTVLAPALILLPPTTSTIPVTSAKPATKPTGSLRPIVPKPRQRDITKTTFSNKVPIPAISTHKHGLFSNPKPFQNNFQATLDLKKNSKKKTIMNKQAVREKCTSLESTKKELSNIPVVNVLENHLNTNIVNNTDQNPNNSKTIPESSTGKKSGNCVAKRKCELTFGNTNRPKIAKKDEK